MSFSFKSFGHSLASAIHDIKVGATYLENHQTQINNVINTGVAVASIADPALAPLASTISRAGEALLGDALAIVSNLDSAAAEKGASVTLDVATIASLKQLTAEIKAVNPSAVVHPAGLPVTASN